MGECSKVYIYLILEFASNNFGARVLNHNACVKFHVKLVYFCSEYWPCYAFVLIARQVDDVRHAVGLGENHEVGEFT